MPHKSSLYLNPNSMVYPQKNKTDQLVSIMIVRLIVELVLVIQALE